MVFLHTKNLNLGIFLRVLEWKMFVYFMTNGHFVYILYNHLVNFKAITWVYYVVILLCFGIM
jgi:hypothetical protein